eukprot:CAMPEP_0185748444 /NCGR_PEP_ID=MMETSP1174-20130828/7135_1 /TAXON_ID=35687 /ORGANISM="Dictyocha speculum, Strain CCMP1381" /LENGTH=30 /DNA_ID= /DNA_START= /DNA_END= /DNA_ORIENTATION=
MVLGSNEDRARADVYQKQMRDFEDQLKEIE